MTFTHVDTPFEIKGVRLKNRLVRAAHSTGYSDAGVTDAFINYHVARARGGVSLSVLEILSAHPSSPRGLNWWTPLLGDGYARLVDGCGRHGMRLFQQLWHGGHNALPRDGSPPWSSSTAPSPMLGVVPLAMTKPMIDEVVEGFAKAAYQCERWGLDGVEIHCAHGYLIAQFLSANHNVREDDYGGTFENRARFAVDVLAAVRAAVSSRFVVGIRVAPDLTVGGIGVTDCIALCQKLEARSLIDFVDVSLGNYETLDMTFSGMPDPAGYELPTSSVITAAVKLPTVVTGRFRTLEEADQVLREGKADLVSMVRATIADPELVSKSLAGRMEDVRPCIGCNQSCVAGILGPARWVSCTVNPAAGFEAELGEDGFLAAVVPKRVVVVGGGPAGMEAARIAALRGHKVTLLEAGAHLGGTLRLARRAPTRQGIDDISVWLQEQVVKLGVDIRLNTFADVDDIVAERPDIVVIATGAMPRMDGVQRSNPGEPVGNIGARQVMSSRDLFSASRDQQFGQTAVVIDDVGHYEGIASAEYLLSKGLAVTYVTRHPSFAPLLESAQVVVPALRRMSQHAFSMRCRTRALRIESEHVVVAATYHPAETNLTERLRADTVVFISADMPSADLVQPLRHAGFEVHVAGDARSPRFLPAAIRDGRVVGASL